MGIGVWVGIGWVGRMGLKLVLGGVFGVSEDGYCCSDVGFWGYPEPRFASWGGVAGHDPPVFVLLDGSMDDRGLVVGGFVD